MKSIDSRALRMPWSRWIMPARSILIFSLFSLMIFSSCEKDNYYGFDGRPGRAFLSFTWIDAKPMYLEAGTYDIPRVFEWGKYYRAYPGLYKLYYEGEYWNGHAYMFYAWEMDYEIWVNPGEPGGYGYNGRDGRDTYFTMELSPFGPYYYYDNGYKNDSGNEVIIESTEDEHIILKRSAEFTIKMKFRKVEKDTKVKDSSVEIKSE